MKIVDITEDWDMYDKTAGGTRDIENPMPHIDADDPLFGEVFDAMEDLAGKIRNKLGLTFRDKIPDGVLPLRNVPMASIIGTESYLDSTNIKSPRRSGDPVQLIKYKGKYFVMDGNHRVVSAYQNGESSIKGQIYEIS